MNFQQKRREINPYVLYGALCVIALFSIIELWHLGQIESIATDILVYTLEHFGWLYLFSTVFFFVCLLYLAFSKFGSIKLCSDNRHAEYSFPAWFAMLFSTAIGVGLLFYGVAEPLAHYSNPILSEPNTDNAKKEALLISYFHWGFYGWGIYALAGCALSFFAYRKQLPLTMRSLFYPLLKNKIYGMWGHTIDILATIATVFGVITTLGIAVTQMSSGLSFIFPNQISLPVQIPLIIILSIVVSISTMRGLERGILVLSKVNMITVFSLLLVGILFGNTFTILTNYFQNIANYIIYLPKTTWQITQLPDHTWLSNWTIFYWAWWIAVAPSISIFIARISRGRTVRELVLGGLVAPSLLTFLWITTFGESALAIHTINPMLTDNTENLSVVLFYFLEFLPLSEILVIIVIIVMGLFYITSADSSVYVISLMTSKTGKEAVFWLRAFWGFLCGIIAIALHLSGGINAFQTIVIIAALPFCIVLIFSAIGFLLSLRKHA